MMIDVDLVKPEAGLLRTAEEIRIRRSVTESGLLVGKHWPVSHIDTVRSSRGEGAEHGTEVGIVREDDLVTVGTEREPVGRSNNLIESVS